MTGGSKAQLVPAQWNSKVLNAQVRIVQLQIGCCPTESPTWSPTVLRSDVDVPVQRHSTQIRKHVGVSNCDATCVTMCTAAIVKSRVTLCDKLCRNSYDRSRDRSCSPCDQSCGHSQTRKTALVTSPSDISSDIPKSCPCLACIQ